MSINFATLQGLTIPEGVVTQITDASGRVLWRSTIKFTINGDTYIADRGMTWAEWFASSYNTTGETEGTITDSNGNGVSMDAVIVGGTAYEVGFAKPVTITVTGTGLLYYVEIFHNGTCYYSPATFTANVGDTISCSVIECWAAQDIYLNGKIVEGSYGENDIYYDFIVNSDATIELYHNNVSDKRSRYGRIRITET